MEEIIIVELENVSYEIFYPKHIKDFKVEHKLNISTPHLIRLFSNFKFLALVYNTNKVLLETNKLKQIRKFFRL